MTKDLPPDVLIAALADPTRLRALQILWGGEEHCVCELMERLGASQSRMSRHMGRLKGLGLVTDRRDAQWVRYRRAPNLSSQWVAIIDAVMAALPLRERRACGKEAA
jgi:ArsR family transcriptional regulator